MNKYEKLVGVLHSSIVRVMSANVLNKVIAMLCNMVITRILPPSEFGLWSYILNVYSYLNLVTGFGLLAGAFQFGAENRGKDEEYSYFKYCFKIGTIIDLFLVIIFIIFSLFYSFSLVGAAPFIRCYIPILIIEYLLVLTENLLRCEDRIREYANILNLNSILISVSTCVGAYIGIFGVIAGKYIANGISLLVVLLSLKKEMHSILYAKQLPGSSKRLLWHYSLLTGLSSTLNCVLYLLDVSMIAKLIKDSTVIATYKVATIIPNALMFIPSSVVIAVLPNIISNQNNVNWLFRYLKKYYMYLMCFNMTLSIMIIIFAPQIITLLSGKRYLGAVPAFRVLIVGYFISGTFRTLSLNVLAGFRRVNFNFFVSIISILCDVIFNYEMIKRFETLGAAYATLGVEVITTIIAFSYVVICLREKTVTKN